MNKAQMEKSLYQLSVIYPFGPKGPEEIRVAAVLWLEDFGDTDPGDFSRAIKMHRAQFDRFPVPKDIKTNLASIRERRRRSLLRLPEQERPDQREINRRGIAAVRAALANGRSGLRV
jgi:hypothetical protein